MASRWCPGRAACSAASTCAISNWRASSRDCSLPRCRRRRARYWAGAALRCRVPGRPRSSTPATDLGNPAVPVAPAGTAVVANASRRCDIASGTMRARSKGSMAMSDIPVTGEVSNSKLAAVFDGRRAAQDAAAALCRELDVATSQVKLIAPGSADVDIKLEPEGGGIWRTIILAHMWLGIWGAVLGLLAFGLLYWGGVPFIVQSPVAALLVLLFFGATAGL